MNNTDNLKKFLKDVAKQSGEIAKKHFGENISIDYKGDDSPVTIADKEIETFIRSKISEAYPQYGIIGEEFEDKNPSADIKFVIDPIDGTKAFIKGDSTFGIMIGAIKHSQPILGVVYQPITDELWEGDNKTTEINGKTVLTSKNKDLNICSIATTGFEYLTKSGRQQFESLASRCKKQIIGGDCYNYCKLAEGKIDIVFEEGLKFHDYAPLIPILRGSGAIISDFKGNEITNFTESLMKELLICSNDNLRDTIFK